jgi:hypothetical protein
MPRWFATPVIMPPPKGHEANDKTALVTFGARGIGHACAKSCRSPVGLGIASFEAFIERNGRDWDLETPFSNFNRLAAVSK